MSDTQWSWIDNIFKTSNDSVYLIGSGIQTLLHNRLINAETWPLPELAKLRKLIEKHKKSGVVILSGDVHLGQVVGEKCSREGIGYRLTEITSSGLSHTCDRNLAGLCGYALRGNTPDVF